jgi:6,7-dimethyl-8-ribityllumazine synthase
MAFEMESEIKTWDGNLSAAGLRFAIVMARFNSFVTERLLSGCLDALRRSGAKMEDVELVKVPGSWEMPITAKALAKQGRFDAIICLGAVIRGDTPHFDYVAGQAASGLANIAAETGVPVAFGVLTTNTVEQAVDRAGAKSGNKGFDAAMTAIEMANLLRKIGGGSK